MRSVNARNLGPRLRGGDVLVSTHRVKFVADPACMRSRNARNLAPACACDVLLPTHYITFMARHAR
jgi:hypothetical protein